MKAESILIDWNGPGDMTSDQKIALINKMGCDVIRFKEAQSADVIWFNGQLADEIKNEVRSILEGLMADDAEAVQKIQNSAITRKKEKRIIVWYNTILTAGNGAIIGTLSSGEDISSQVQAEWAQSKSNEKFRLLIEDAKEAILVIQDSKFKYVNSKAGEFSGYSQAELMDRSLADLIKPEDRKVMLDRDPASLENGGIHSRFRMVAKNGECKLVDVNTVSTTWDGRTATLIFLEEINKV
jgi:PAS domain S-box-containing protein